MRPLEYFNIYNLCSVEIILAIVYGILIVGLSFPYGIPILFPLLLLSFSCLFIKNLREPYLALKLNTGIVLFYVCILAYLLGILFNQGLVFRGNFRDLKNIASLLILSWILGTLNWGRYKRFILFYHRLIVPVMSLIALLSLYNFYRLIIGASPILMGMERSRYAFGTSLSGSYNMFALGMLAGIFAAVSGFSQSRSMLFRAVCGICIVLCTTAVLFAGSRRGWVMVGLLVVPVGLKFVASCFRFALDGGVRFFSLVRKHRGSVFVVLVLASSIAFTFLAQRDLDVQNPLELKRLAYRLSTLGDERGGFRRAFSKRTDLWTDAADLIEAFNFYELFLGSGFEFLQFYGWKSRGGVGSEGDPHNFIISAILYSGFIGSAAILALIFLTFFQLLTKRDKYGSELLLLYVATLIFTITGAPSFFSVRLLPVITLTVFSVKN